MELRQSWNSILTGGGGFVVFLVLAIFAWTADTERYGIFVVLVQLIPLVILIISAMLFFKVLEILHGRLVFAVNGASVRYFSLYKIKTINLEQIELIEFIMKEEILTKIVVKFVHGKPKQIYYNQEANLDAAKKILGDKFSIIRASEIAR